MVSIETGLARLVPPSLSPGPVVVDGRLRACEKIRDWDKKRLFLLKGCDSLGHGDLQGAGMTQRGTARVVTAERQQTSFDLIDLDSWLPADHHARTVVAFVERLDLRRFYTAIIAREGGTGRPALDPAVLLALWLYATLDGVGSARAIERLSETELAYRWLRGGMPLNYHSLSDFRIDAAADLDRLLSESLADLIAEGLVSLDEVLIDGTKVRAAAGHGSYKTAVGLAAMEEVARAHIAELAAELDADPAAGLRRRLAARERAARERLQRIEAAKAMRAQLERERAARSDHSRGSGSGSGSGGSKPKSEPKASITDPQARVMRFADGAHAPGYNVQVAATPEHGFILAITATDRRNDSDLAGPMTAEIARRLGRAPCRVIADQGYASANDIVTLATASPPIAMYTPVPADRLDIKPQYLVRRQRRRELEPEPIKEWRARMTTEVAKLKIKQRKRIELVNAHLKVGDFARQVLRGLAKVQGNCVLAALAHNLKTAARIRRQLCNAAT
jgi:transposase